MPHACSAAWRRGVASQARGTYKVTYSGATLVPGYKTRAHKTLTRPSRDEMHVQETRQRRRSTGSPGIRTHLLARRTSLLREVMPVFDSDIACKNRTCTVAHSHLKASREARRRCAQTRVQSARYVVQKGAHTPPSRSRMERDGTLAQPSNAHDCEVSYTVFPRRA